jgi:hypothetical protein
MRLLGTLLVTFILSGCGIVEKVYTWEGMDGDYKDLITIKINLKNNRLIVAASVKGTSTTTGTISNSSTIEEFPNCTIFDSNNWECSKTRDDFIMGYKLVDGELIYYVNLSKVRAFSSKWHFNFPLK